MVVVVGKTPYSILLVLRISLHQVWARLLVHNLPREFLQSDQERLVFHRRRDLAVSWDLGCQRSSYSPLRIRTYLAYWADAKVGNANAMADISNKLVHFRVILKQYMYKIL